MAVYFNLNDKYKNVILVSFDTTISSKFKDFYEDMVVFRDQNLNVNSINLLNSNYELNEQFGFLNLSQKDAIIETLLKHNKDYKINDKGKFLLGKIIKRETHPKSDKLFVLQVDFGCFKDQIITNTTYTLEDKFFVFALPGVITAKGTEIVSSKVMNVESNGMLAIGHSFGFNDEKHFFEGNLENYVDSNKLEELKGMEVQNILREIKEV